MKRLRPRTLRVSIAKPRALSVSLARFSSAMAVCAALMAGAGTARAADQIWDPNGNAGATGGSGNWIDGGATWSPGPWSNAALDTAIFGGTGAGPFAVTVDATGITAGGLTFNSAAYTIAGPGTLTLGTGSTITMNAAATISASLSAADFSVTGTGLLTLTGSNTITTGLLLSSGNLAIGNSAALGAGTLTIAGTGSSVQAGGGAQSVGNAVSANADFTVTGTNSLTFTGTTTLSAARAITLNNTALTTFGAISGTNTNLTFNGGGAATITGIVGTGSGTLAISGGTSVTLSNTGNTFTGNITVDGAGSVLAYPGSNGAAGDPLALGSGTKSITLTNGAAVSPSSTSNPTSGTTKSFVIGTGGGTFNVATGVTFTLDDATQFSGTGDLTVTSAGTGLVRILTQAYNGFTGNVNVNSGTLLINNTNSLGNTAGKTVTVAAGAVFDMQAANVPQNITLNGTGISSGGALINSSTTAASTASPISLASNSSIGTGGTGGITLSGVISEVTPGTTLTKVGANTLTLAGAAANTYTGVTTVSAGTLALNKTAGVNAIGGDLTVAGGTASLSASNQIPDTAALAVSSGIFDFNGKSETLASMTLTGGTTQTNTAGAVVVVTGAGSITGATTQFVINSGAQVSFNSLSLTGGTGTNFLQGGNSATETLLTVGPGGLALNGTLYTINPGTAGTAGGRLLLNGDVTVGGTAASSLLVGTANPVAPRVDLGTDPTRTFNVADATASSAADLTIAISVVGSSGLTKTGAGTMVLSNANTYTGVTTVSGGILRLSNATALPGGIGATGGTNNLSLGGGGVIELGTGDFSRGLGTGATQVQFTGSSGFSAFGGARAVNLGGASAPVVWGTGSFVPNGSVLILGSASSDNTLTFQNPLDLNTATSRTIQADNGSAAIDATISGVISATGGGGLTKTGLGTLSLSATNTYAGTTTVNAGTLSVAANANLGPTPGSVVSNSIILDGGTLGTTATFTLDTNRGILVGSSPGSGTGTIDVATSTTLTYGGVIANNGPGADNFVKTGAGTLILTGSQTYTGTTTVSQGSLQIAPNALASSSIDLTGGTLLLLADGNGLASGFALPVTPGLTIPNPEIAATFDDALTLSASSAITVGRNTSAQALNKSIVESGGLTTNGAFALTVNNNNQYGLNLTGITNLTTAAPTFSVATALTSQFVPGLTLSGQVTGGFGFTKTGVGTMVLTNNIVGVGGNDFTGNVTVTGGVLGATSNAALGTSTNNIILNGTTATFEAFDDLTTSRSFTFSNTTAANNVIGVVGSKTLTINSAFTGANGYTKIDNGTLVLTANNSAYTGQLVVTAGLVRLTNSDALGSGGASVPAIANLSGAALQLDGTGGNLLITRPITLAASGGINAGVNSGGALENYAGNNTLSGTLILSFDAGIGADSGSTLNLTGPFTTNGHFLNIYGDGTINFNSSSVSAALYAINKFGNGTTNWGLAMTIANNGPSLHGGLFNIAGTGATITPAAGWLVDSGATLKADDSGTALANRLGTTPKTMNLATGKLEYQVNATAGSSETIGALTSTWGANTIQVDTTGQTSTITFASLAGNAVNGGSTLTFKAGAAGTGLAFGATSNKVIFTTAPTLSSPLIGIIPRSIVIDATGTNFATYNNNGLTANTNGIQALASSNIPTISSTTVTGTNTTVTVPSTAGLTAGMAVYGPTVSAGATIGSILSPTTYTITGTITGGAAGQLLAYGNTPYTDVNSTNPLLAATGDNVKFGSGFVINGSNIAGTARTFGSFNLSGPGTTVNSGAGSGSGTYTLTSGNILSTGAGTNTIGSGAIIAAGAAEIGLNIASGNTLVVNGTLTNATNVTKGLDGNLTFGGKQYFNTGAAVFTINGGGTVTLPAGVTNTLFPGVQGGTIGNYLAVGQGATLNLNGGVQMVGTLYSPNNLAYPGSGGTITSVAAATFVNAGGATAGWGGQITDNVFYAKAGNTTQTIYSDNTYTGGTLINGGTVVLRDSGKLSGSGPLSINYSSLILYNDGLSGDFDRINDNSAITLNGGTLGFKGRQATTSTETVGDVLLASGTSVISAAEGTNQAGLMDGILTLNSLSRTASAGATVGFAQIYNVPTGTASSGLGLMGSGEKIIVNGLTTTNNIVGGWAAATAGFFQTSFVEFASYNGLGVGPLTAAGFAGYDGTALVANQPTQNIRLTAGGAVTTGGSTVNSLNLASNQTAAVTLTFGGTNDILNVTSGGLMIQNVIGSSGATTIGTSGGNLGKITAGGSTPGPASDLYLYYYANGNPALTINSQITDNLNGTGTNLSGVNSAVRLVLWGGTNFSTSHAISSTTLTNPANDYSGGTVVNQSNLTIGATGKLPAGGVTLNGSTLTQAVGGTIASQLVTLNGSSTLTLAAATNNSLPGIVFNNNGGVTNPAVASGGVLSLTGATPISVTTISNPSTIATVSGTLDFGNAAKSIFVDPTTVNGQAVAPLTPGLNITALIQNSGLLTKTGNGVLQLSSTTSTFTGGVNLSAGGLVIGASSNFSARSFPEFQVAVLNGPLGTGTLSIAGGTRILSSASANTIGNLVTIGGNFEFDGLNNVTLNGDATLGAATRTISVNAPQMTATLGGVISGGAGAGIVKNGYGTLILGNANPFSGDVTLNSGTLVGNLPFSQNVSVSPLGSGAVTYNGGNLSVRSATDGDFRNNINVNSALTAVNLDVQGTSGPNTIRMGNLDLAMSPNPTVAYVNVTGGTAANPSTLVVTTNSLDNNATPASVARAAGEFVNVNVAANTTLAITSGGFARNNEPLNIGPGTLLLGGTNFFANNTTVTTSNTGAAPLANATNAVYGNTGQTVTLSGTGLLYTIAPQVGAVTVGAIPGATAGGLQQTFTNVTASGLATAANWGVGPGSVFNGVQPNDASTDRVAYTNPNSGLVTYNGFLNIGTGGTYNFIVGADDNSSLIIDGVEIARDSPGGHALQDTARGSITLSAGQHAITLKVNVGTGQPGGGSRLLYSGPDTAANSGNNGYQAIPSTALSYFTGPASAANNYYNAAQIDNDYALAASSSATLQGLGADFNSTLKSLTLGATSTLGATNDLGAIGVGGTGFIGVKGVTTVAGAGATLSPTTANLYLIGGINDGAALGLAKTGAGTLSLNNSTAFTGAFAINAGTVRLFESNALSTGANTVASGASLDLNGVASSAGRNVTINAAGTTSQFGSLYNSSPVAGSLGGNLTLATASTIAGYGDITISGNVTSSTLLTKLGPDTLTLSGSNGSMTGGLTITAGVVNNGSATGLGGGAGIVTVNTGAALNLNGNNTDRAITFNGTSISNQGPNQNTLGNLINSSLSASFSVPNPAAAGSAQLKQANTAATATISGNITLSTATTGIGSNTFGAGGDIIITGIVSGTQLPTKVGGNNLFLRGVNTFVAGPTINAGTMTLDGAGVFNGAGGAITVNEGASFVIDNGTTFTNNRVNNNNAANNRRLILAGGTLTITGNATNTNDVTELFSASLTTDTPGLRLDQGHTNINLTPVATGGSLTVTFTKNGTASDVQGGNASTGLIVGRNLGQAAAGTVDGNANIILTNGLSTASGLHIVGQGSNTANGGANGSTTKGISPFIIVDDVINGANFATYDSIAGNTFGIRGLDTLGSGSGTNEYVAANTNTLVASNNTLITAATTTLTSFANANISINSLKLTGSTLTLAQGSNLNIQSGGVLATADATIAGPGIISVDGSPLGSTTGASQNLYIHTIGVGTDLTVSANIGFSAQNSGRLGEVDKAGTGNLILSGANFYTTNTRVQEGTLTLGNDLAIYYRQTAPASPSNFNSSNNGPTLQINQGGTVDLNGFDLTVNNLNSINPAGGQGSLSGGTVMNSVAGTKNFVINNTAAQTWSGNISSGTGTVAFSRYGQLNFTITNENTYTGATVIGGGINTLVDVGALRGTSGVSINSAALIWNDNGTQGDAYRLGATPAAVTFNGGGFQYNGRAGAFSVANLGAVTLASGASQFTANAGSNGNATIQMSTFTRNPGAVVNFAGSVLGDDGNVKVTGGVMNFNGIVGGWATSSMSNPYLGYIGSTAIGAGSFVEYDPATGFRAIVDFRSTGVIDYASGLDRPAFGTAAFGVNSNVRVNSNTTLAPGNTVANSMVVGVNGTTTLTFTVPADTLFIQSGGILGTTDNNAKLLGASVAGGGDITAGNSDGTAGPGNPNYDLYLHNLGNTMTVFAQIVDNPVNPGAPHPVNLITSTGSQNGPVIRLSNTNTYTGSTTVNSTDLRLDSIVGPAIANSTSISIVGGNENAADSSRQAMSRIFFENAGSQLNSGATVSIINNATLDTNNFNQTLAGLVFNNTGGHTSNSGGLGGSVRTGAGTLTLIGNITATNLTNISTIPFIAGNLDLNGGQRTITVDAITGAGVQGAAQIGLSIFAGMSNGGIDKEGTGVLAITGLNTYTGATNVNTGTLVLAGRDQSSPGGVLTANIAGSRVDVDAGATVDMRGGNAIIGSLNGAGTVTNSVYATTSAATGMPATLTIGADNTSTGDFSGRFTNFINNINEATGYALNVTKLGTGIQTISADNALPLSPGNSNGDINNVGTLDIQEGGILVNGANGSLGFTAINLRAGATLTLDNSTVNKPNRLGGFRLTDSANGDTANDTTGARTISMQGGTITFKEGASLVNEGNFNTLSMTTNPGVGSVTLLIGSSTWNFDNTGGSAGATVEANAFTAGNGSLTLNAGATQTLGRAAAGANSINVYVPAGMTGQGTGSLSAPNTALGTANAGVQGNIVGGIRPDMIGTDSTGTGFVTYDRFGYRLLQDAEYSIFPAQPHSPQETGSAATPNNPPPNWTAVVPTITATYTGNARLNTAQTWTTNTSVFDLRLDSGGGLTSAGGSVPLVNSPTQLFNALGTLNTLTVSTGSIIGNTGNTGLTGGAITAGGNALRIYAFADLASSSYLLSTSNVTGLIKEGAGILNLTKPGYFGSTTDVGQTVVNAGTLWLNSGAANTLAVLNTAAGSVANSFDTLTINAGATVDLKGFDQVVGTLNSADLSPGGGGTLTSTSAANFYANANGTFGGSIAGMVNLYKTGANNLVLTSASTSSGAVTVQGGILSLQDSGTMASLTYNLNGASLQYDNRAASLSGIEDRTPVTATWNMNTGRFLGLGRPSQTIVDNVGTVNALQGFNELRVDSATGSANALNIDTLNATAGAQVFFVSSNAAGPGGSLGNAGLNPTISFDNFNAGTMTIGNVIPWAVVQPTSDSNTAAIAMYNTVINPLTGSPFGVATPNVAAGGFTTPNYQDTAITGGTTGENINHVSGTTTEVSSVTSRTFNSLRFSQNASATLNLAPAELLRLEAGVIVSAQQGLTLANGRITTGLTNNTATTFYVNPTNNAVTITSQIVDNGSGALTLVKGGANTLTLNPSFATGLSTTGAAANATTAGSPIVVIAAAPSTPVAVGDAVTGPGIANGAVVTVVNSTTNFTISAPAFATTNAGTFGFGAAQVLTGTNAAAATTITVTNDQAAGLFIGALVGGNGVATTLTAIGAADSGGSGLTNLTIASGTGVTANQALSYSSAANVSTNSGYSGGTFVNSTGTLSLGGAVGSRSLGGGSFIINSGGIVTMTNAGQIAPTTNLTINGGGRLTFTPVTTVSPATGGINVLNNVTFNNNGGTVVPTLDVGASGFLTIKSGLVSSASDNQGTTPLLTNGTLNFGQISLGTSTTGSADVTVADVAGFVAGQTVVGVNIPTGTTILSITGNTLTLSNTVATGGTGAVSTLNQAAGSTTAMIPTLNVTTLTPGKVTPDLQISSVIANSTVGGAGLGGWSNLANGGAALTKTGNGNLTLSAANTFDNGFNLVAGTVTVGNAAAFGTGTLSIAGGTLTTDLAAKTITNPININGDFTFGGQQASHNITQTTGAVNLGGATRNITVTSPLVTATISGVISNGGLTKSGDGILTLNGANLYAGGTILNGGLVIAGNASALGANTNDLTVKSNATLNMNGQSLTVDGLNGDNDTMGGLITNTGATATLTIGNNNEATATFAGTLTNTGINATTNALGLTKVGSGTQILNGTNTYTGPTNVTAGTLVVNGLQASATGLVTVALGATLGGTGTINGPTTIQTGGNLKPGTSAGLLTFNNNLTLGGDTTNSTFEIQGTARGIAGGYDAINLGSTSLLTYDGVLTLDISIALSNGTFDLFAFTAAPTGSFDQVTLLGGGGYSGNLTNSSGVWSGDSQGQTFIFTQATGDLMIVPEPSALVSLLGGLGVLLGFRRARRRG